MSTNGQKIHASKLSFLTTDSDFFLGIENSKLCKEFQHIHTMLGANPIIWRHASYYRKSGKLDARLEERMILGGYDSGFHDDGSMRFALLRLSITNMLHSGQLQSLDH
jgi:hypothetical protein